MQELDISDDAFEAGARSIQNPDAPRRVLVSADACCASAVKTASSASSE
jgi:hypothetical protein